MWESMRQRVVCRVFSDLSCTWSEFSPYVPDFWRGKNTGSSVHVWDIPIPRVGYLPSIVSPHKRGLRRIPSLWHPGPLPSLDWLALVFYFTFWEQSPFLPCQLGAVGFPGLDLITFHLLHLGDYKRKVKPSPPPPPFPDPFNLLLRAASYPLPILAYLCCLSTPLSTAAWFLAFFLARLDCSAWVLPPPSPGPPWMSESAASPYCLQFGPLGRGEVRARHWFLTHETFCVTHLFIPREQGMEGGAMLRTAESVL